MRVFVTGATGFIGTAVVQELLGAGHHVTGLARSDASAAGLALAGAEAHRGSLEEAGSLAEGARAADGVVHLAFNHDFSTYEQNAEDDRVVTAAMAEAMEGTNKPLVVTSGTAVLAPGRVGVETDPPTTQTRAKSELVLAWADRGVRVNAVSPGFIVTEMTRPALEGLGMTTWIASRTPMRRVGELDEIVGPVLFLASDMAGYITGHDLAVDGGTNASNGSYQIPPIHHVWNADTQPRVGVGYDGIVARPERFEALAAGIPGVHYPAPEV